MTQPITEQEYIMLRDLIHRESGISLVRLKKETLITRVSRRLRELGCDTFGDYYRAVSSDTDELYSLIDRVSTNVTQFFREPGQFALMEKTVLPGIFAEAPEKLRVWSAGCSTGEEACSIIMTVLEFLEKNPFIARPDFKVLASDISIRVMEKAKRGVYAEDCMSQVPPELAKKYFLKGIGENAGLYMAKKALREPLLFRRINLTETPYPVRGVFDMIFCRNVLIYFEKETQDRVIASLLEFLKPGGYLFCGHSESLVGARSSLANVQPCVYRKVTAQAQGIQKDRGFYL